MSDKDQIKQFFIVQYEKEEKLEVGEDVVGEEKKTSVLDEQDDEDERMRTIKETIEMLDLDGKGNKPQPDWMKSIDLQQYNGLAVVTIPGAALSKSVM